MNNEESKEPVKDTIHLERHKMLHNCFDELLADFISHTGKLPSETTIYELMQWSYKQSQDPED